jgi:hypothetical protein
MDLVPGARPLPEYQLVSRLGQGGFGEVWRASGPGGFDVALKFIRLSGPGAPVELRALEQMKGIRHAHLLTVFGAWRREDFVIVAMELAEGTILTRWQQCREEGLLGIPATELLERMREAAKGLDYLNEVQHPTPSGSLAGVQHKDVKPQNLLLVGGVVKVADFGLAQVIEQTAASASGGLTPAYAAPEIFQGRATRGSDQYSLAICYCLLRGGRLPFTGSALELMSGHLSKQPNLDMLPDEEQMVVERALDKEPEHRWPSCRLFVEALATVHGPERMLRTSADGDLASRELALCSQATVNSQLTRLEVKIGIDLADLKRAIADTDPSAILVGPRVLRRVLQAAFKSPHLLTRVPHEYVYFFDRQELFRHVEPDELGLDPDHRLPQTVILLARPSTEQMQAQGRDAMLSRYWRLLFHAHVHVALDKLRQEGRLTPADIRARVEQIGPTEFSEIRTVLLQENGLLPPPEDLHVYIEFVAFYLELRYFRNNLVSTYFPAISDFSRIDELIARDVDGDTLFARTRLPGARDPVVRTDNSYDESHDYYWRMLRNAERIGKTGDTVRAAIIRTRAARIAPPLMAQETHAEALRDLRKLTLQLQEAVQFPPEEVPEWLQVLPSLLDKADQGQWPVEAKLLYDLQKICHEHSRKLYGLDLVEWALSAGKRPVKRPLNVLQRVRMTNHLRSAAQRLTMARVSDDDRKRLAKLLQSAQHECEERLRVRIRPILLDAFSDVGLVATNPPEQVALQKMIEELLDKITENGFFTFSDLRDTIAGNQFKLPDLPDPNAFWRGDPLLRLDRRLAPPMEGVYRAGAPYLRWMESIGSLFFGTAVGRLFTRNIIMPFFGALLLIKGVTFMWEQYMTKPDIVDGVKVKPPLAWRPWPQDMLDFAFVPLGAFFFCLINIPPFRDAVGDALSRLGRWLHYLFWELPAQFWDLVLVQQFFKSWPFLLIYWYVLQPLGVYAVLVIFWPTTFGTWLAGIVTFLAANLVLNSMFGEALGELIKEALAIVYGWLRFDALRGLIRLVNAFFKQVTEAFEYVLYSVDEWLRFRSDEGRLTAVVRAVTGVLWYPVRGVIRLYFVTLIEPTVNPLKLPIGILAAKFYFAIPYIYKMMTPGTQEQQDIITSLAGISSHRFALFVYYLIIWPTAWLATSAVAFLVWELRANWRLYRANRAARMRAAVVGRHGETMLQLVKPGHHSGTIPTLFATLRRAERGAYHTNNWRPARATRLALKEAARSVQVFVEREFIALLRQSKSFPGHSVGVVQVVLSCTRIRIELAHAGYPGEPVWLTLEEQAGWLLGGVGGVGWLAHLTDEQKRTLTAALAGLYKLAGVDFSREQLAIVLPPALPAYQLSGHDLILWADTRDGRAVRYDLRDRDALIQPHGVNDGVPPGTPPLESRRLFFSRAPMTWEQWVECWKQDQEGKGPSAGCGEGMKLLPV